MFISRTAMKLPFTWGIRQNKQPSKYFQRLLSVLECTRREGSTPKQDSCL